MQTITKDRIKNIMDSWDKVGSTPQDFAINNLRVLFGETFDQYLAYRHIYTSYDILEQDEQSKDQAKSQGNDSRVKALWSRIDFVNGQPDTSLWKMTDDGSLYPIVSHEDMAHIIRDLKMIEHFNNTDK